MIISVLFNFIMYTDYEEKPNIISNVWSDVGKARGAHFSDPNTGSDVTLGQELLLNFTSYSCLKGVLHKARSSLANSSGLLKVCYFPSVNAHKPGQ